MTATPDDPAPSPCIRHCTLDEQDMCVGCGRMLGEIMEWAASATERKVAIRSAAAMRLEQRRLRWRPASLRPQQRIE